jgi:hypothetical protein
VSFRPDTVLRQELRARLGRLGAPLQLLAEDVLGEEDQRIDWVAVEPGGRLCVVLVGGPLDGEALLARGLAQRAWVQARIRDWQQLAPGLAARADLRPRLLLVAADFSRVALRAAQEADAEAVRLARFRWEPADDGRALDLRLELVGAAPAPSLAAAERPQPPLASVFRSGLDERDFGGAGIAD